MEQNRSHWDADELAVIEVARAHGRRDKAAGRNRNPYLLRSPCWEAYAEGHKAEGHGAAAPALSIAGFATARIAGVASALSEAERMREIESPSGWWYISFADSTRGFLGGLVVQGTRFGQALRNARMLRLDPGGSAAGVTIPDGRLPPGEFLWRLLSRDDVQRMDHAIIERVRAKPE